MARFLIRLISSARERSDEIRAAKKKWDNMGTPEQDAAAVKLRMERVSAQIEELKLWSDAELARLRSRLHAQIGRLQTEVAQLHVESPAESTTDYAARIEAQLTELAAKGDSVYELLRSSLEKAVDK